MLVSVKSCQEAAIAVSHELVSIVDLKNPHAGALGYAGVDVVIQVADQIKRRKRFSVALGELDEWASRKYPLSPEWGEAGVRSVEDLNALPWPAIDFVKVGLTGRCSNAFGIADRLECLDALFAYVPVNSKRVLVVYADVFSPHEAHELLTGALKWLNVNPEVVLLDTFDKSCGGLFDHYRPEQCRQLIHEAESYGLKTVLAGSIDFDQLPMAREADARLIGVRGAACQRGDDPGCAADGQAIAPPAIEDIRTNDLSPIRMDQFLQAAQVTLVNRG